MPFVEVKVAGELEEAQRKEISKGIAELLNRVTGKPIKATYVVIQEVPRDHWGVGDQLLSER